MKPIINIIAVCLLLFCSSAQAQQPIDEEKVNKAVALMKKMQTNPGELQSIMAEMQALKLNSAENKEAKARMQKDAINQAGEIKKQVTATGGITEKQITEFKENKDRIVPVRDEVRINAVLKRDLSDGELKNYCKAVFEAVKKEMNAAAVSQAEIIYAKLKAKYPTTVAMGNGAISCYLYNLTQQSIYIMGKVCSEDAGDDNNLNNYAALLTNHGVEQGAIPILNYLNRKYAKSPVALSNLSVAWMGLGEFKMAEKYADSCIRFFPGNAAQAHYVKAVVKESEGNRQGAIEEMKQSIGESYSAEKESLLKKMGGKLTASDYKKILPADALGLSKFNFPALPRTYEAALNSKLEWTIFYKNLESSIKELEIKTERLRKEYDKKAEADAKSAINFAKQKSGKFIYAFAANNNTNQSWNNFYQLLDEEFIRKEEAFMKEARQLTEQNSKMLDQLDTIVKVQLAKRFEQDALGKKFTDAEACNAYKQAYDNYMQPANTMFEKFYTAYIDHKRKMTNELVYAGKQFMDKAYYEYYASNSKLQFLYALQSVSYEIPSYSPGNLGGYASACINVKTNSFTNKGLANWNDLNCGNKWEMKLPGSEVSTDCNKITFKFDILVAEGSYSEDLFTGQWTNMSLEIGVGIGSKKITDKSGIEVGGAGAEVGAFIEIDRTGITDYGGKGKVGLEGSGITLIGAEGKVSLKSGNSSFEVKSDMSKASVSYK
ncbi:MAG: hypothetical protein K2X48_12600 [Chitinophagaceae bacterium]|nr:hypothetical protein [Chitinophagaceae bacterium]